MKKYCVPYIHLLFIIFYLKIWKTNLRLSFTNPLSIYLSNGNLFIIHKYGIEVCNKYLTEIIKSQIIFEEEEFITTQKLSKVILSKFEDGYIISLINNKIYFFDEEGNFLYKSERIDKEKNPDYYNLNIKDKYHFYIGFISEDKLNLYYYEYSKSLNITQLIASKEDFKCFLNMVNRFFLRNRGVNCHIMINTGIGETLACFYILYNTNTQQDTFAIGFYKINEDKIEENWSYWPASKDCENINFLKVDVNSEGSKALICLILSNGENNCFIYDIYASGFKMDYLNCNKKICRNEYYGFKIKYYNETNEFIFSCLGEKGNITYCVFNNFEFYEINKFDECDNINGYSTLYSNNANKYYIISDEICNGNEILYNPLIDKEEEKEKEKENEKELEKEIENEKNIKNEIETEEEEIINKEIIEYKCQLEKCQICDSKSEKNNLCIKCNIFNGYYPLNAYQLSEYELFQYNNDYIDCVNDETKPSNFYFNSINKYYEPCYEKCAACKYGGDDKNNNCTSCDIGYILKPEFKNNCVIKCEYYYYYTYYGQYKCTETPQCPNDYNLLIKEKGKCTNNCSKDDIYLYQYNGECLKQCPTNTSDGDNDYICKDSNSNICSISKRDIIISNENITNEELEKLAQNYANEFSYTDNHISSFVFNNYEIIFYKNVECISDLSLEIPKIDLGECYKKVQNNYFIDDNLILAVVSQKINGINYHKIMSFSIYDPDKGKQLKINDICVDDSLIVDEDLSIKIDDKLQYNLILHLTKQNIDVFNASSEFYTDICFSFESPIDKDIALKDRINLFFPNVTLCENGCTIKGVNSTLMKAKCECKLNNLLNNNILSNNAWYQSQIGQIKEIISQTNIIIITCIKEFFKYKYVVSSIGFYIVITLIVFQITLTIILCTRNILPIKKYAFDIIDKYSLHISNKINEGKINEPIKKKIKRKSQNIKQTKKFRLKTNLNRINKKYSISLKNSLSEYENIIKHKNSNNQHNNNIFVINNIGNTYDKIKHSPKSTLKSSDTKRFSFNNKLNSKNNENYLSSKYELNNNMDNYLETEFDDMIFEDVLEKDKRKFCNYFFDKLKTKLMIIDTFFNHEPFRPRTIRILLFILDIDLYLFVNALFINEDFVSEIFHSNKEDTFFSFISRSFDRIFYTTLVGAIVKYMIECFFIEEKAIKSIIKRGKNDLFIIKTKIYKILKKIIIRFVYFIIISFIITSFTLYYISCFNYIYPHMKLEWIKSSIFILIIRQILSSVTILIESIIRYIGFLFKSERIYKISLFLS